MKYPRRALCTCNVKKMEANAATDSKQILCQTPSRRTRRFISSLTQITILLVMLQRAGINLLCLSIVQRADNYVLVLLVWLLFAPAIIAHAAAPVDMSDYTMAGSNGGRGGLPEVK